MSLIKSHDPEVKYRNNVGMLQLHRFNRLRCWAFLYITIATIAFIWVNSGGFPQCTQTEIHHLTKKYKIKVQELEQKLHNLSIEILKVKNNNKDPLENKLISNLNNRNDESAGQESNLPTIYLVTPTHTHSEQKANLVKLAYTLRHVRNLHWILVEDSAFKTDLVRNFLMNAKVPYTHLNALTPPEIKMKQDDPTWLKPKGVLQRNSALKWIRENVDPKKRGVLYFADDDNTYSLEIFDEMRNTHKVSVWPVGLVGGLRYEKPEVRDGKVVGWFTYWKPSRPFPMDMAGFAINIDLLFKYPDAAFSNEVPRGYQESTILKQLHVELEDLEPKADGCTKVLVWHTRTEKTRLHNEDKMEKKYGKRSDPNIEV